MKKLFATSIITIGLCTLLLFVKNQYSCLLLTNSTYGMPALIRQGSVKNLYLGSSMFRQGLDINLLDDSTYILSYNGNQPCLEYYELKYLLDHDVHIENLYIDMYVYSAWEEPEISDEKLFMEIGIPEKYILWKLIKTNPESSNFEALWRIWVNSNNELILTWPVSSPVINSQFHQGGSLTRTNSLSPEALAQTTAPAIMENINSTQEYYIKELIQLARNNQINLLFVETPKYETVANDASYLSAIQKYAELLDEEQAAYVVSENTLKQCQLNNVQFYSFDVSNENYYMDSVHLAYHGRTVFTNTLYLIQDHY